jgi:Xaa-Pro aminopeptidase
MCLLLRGGRYSAFGRGADVENALTIHYTRNSEEIQPEDMVLVDAGGVQAPFFVR